MKKLLVMIMATAAFAIHAQAQLFSTSTAQIDFYSKTPVEDIEAHSKNAVVILDTKANNVVFQVQNTSFQFPNKLMQEHFNEKYIESEKFPKSLFSGKVNQTIDYSKDGSHDVTVTGKLTVHGVAQDRTINGKLTIKGGSIQLISDFKIKVSDHKIEIPTVVTAKIAEEISVHVDALLNPKK